MSDPTPASTPAIPLATILELISSVTRWKILRELADGGSLLVSELSKRLGVDPSVISRHLTPLREAGVVSAPRAKLYAIAPQYITDKANRVVDFGWCVLRLNTGR